MKDSLTHLGPAFCRVPHQDHPAPTVCDLGIQMQWGNRTARLYRNVREHATYAFRFEDVVVHEEDVIGAFSYQECQARKTHFGMFFPLTGYIQGFYRHNRTSRPIFDVLTELSELLPPDRRVTVADIHNFASSLGKAPPLPPPAPVKPPIGMLDDDLEDKGFRLCRCKAEAGRALLDIGWQPLAGSRVFFVGVLELRPAGEDISGQWMLPGPCGVNETLRQEFEKHCHRPADCLAPAGRKHCLTGVRVSSAKMAKHKCDWPENVFPTQPDVMSSSATSLRKTELS